MTSGARDHPQTTLWNGVKQKITLDPTWASARSPLPFMLRVGTLYNRHIGVHDGEKNIDQGFEG